MQKKVKSRLLDVLIVAVCLSVFCISIRFFWIDLNTSSTRQDKDEIARIEFKRNIAQRKFNDRVVWERLQQNSPLYDYDIVRTAEDAAATVTFKDGTVLELYENTMLQVSYTEDGLQISVNDGNIEVDTTASKETKKVALSMDNGSVLKLDSGSKVSAASNSDSGDNSFKLQSGNATVTTKAEPGKAATTQSITSGETVKIEANGEVKKEPLTVTSISSETKLYAFNNEKTLPVKLAWNVSNDYEKSGVKVETSLSKNFDKIQSSFVIKDSNSMDLQSPVGRLYWRVYPEGEEKQSAQGRITVESVKKVVPVSPAKNATFTYRKETELPKLAFVWNGNDYADHYKLEISKTQDFSESGIEVAENILSTSYNINSFVEGTYYWRVTPYYKLQNIGYGESSPVYSFTIEKKEELLPPKLSVPANNAKLTFNISKENQVGFQWKSDVKTADYRIVISDTKDFKNIVYESKTSRTKHVNAFTLEELPEGQYFWRVYRSSEEDEGTIASEIRAFVVEKYIPGETKLIFPPENYSVENSKLKATAFMWKLASEYQNEEVSSRLQISSNPGFDKNVREFETKEQTIKDVSLDSGTYYWRVAVGENYTPARSMVVLNQLGRPVINNPVSDSTLTVAPDSQVRVAWTQVSDADYYKVKIYDGKDKIIAEENSLKRTNASFLLPADTYKCTVQAFTEETELSPRRTGKVATVNFTLRNALPVELISPVNNARIPGLTALRNPTVLTWKQGDKVEKSQFVLRKLQPNGTYKTVQTMENPRTQIRLQRLEAGTYQWTIQATGTNGIVLNGGTNSFVVTQIPELQPAKLLFPVNRYVIGSDYLKTNRNITFNWSNVEGATDYKFTLYQKNKNGTLKKLYEEKTGRVTEVKYKDLASLDVGEFEWNVTAYAHAGDGFEEQKGKVSTGNFRIEFTLPGKVQTIDPGKLYGE